MAVDLHSDQLEVAWPEAWTPADTRKLHLKMIDLIGMRKQMKEEDWMKGKHQRKVTPCFFSDVTTQIVDLAHSQKDWFISLFIITLDNFLFIFSKGPFIYYI